ncbi:MAG: MoxR family ATPase [Planctomycetaceae bacterium]|jgi:MoxR-like ATPase|nr:MoxR family ATPase [Planctomycetaceae bacterium]
MSETLRRQLEQLCSGIDSLEKEIGSVIAGQREVIRSVIIAMTAGGHVLLEGVPGLGKTLLVKTLADAVSGTFSRIQFTPDLMPADITGTNILGISAANNRRFEFQSGPVFANIVLADEINRATPKTQSALLEAMQEHSVTVGGTTHKLGNFFFVLATQNPLEMEGTYPLPEAQLDRFFAKILVPFPSADDLITILDRTTAAENYAVKAVLSTDDILTFGRLSRDVPVAEEIKRYAVDLCLATHPDGAKRLDFVKRYVRFGVSPRAAQALLLGAKINAVLAGRYNVSREDIQLLAPMIFRHRIILNFEGQAENITPDEVVKNVVGL